MSLKLFVVLFERESSEASHQNTFHGHGKTSNGEGSGTHKDTVRKSNYNKTRVMSSSGKVQLN